MLMILCYVKKSWQKKKLLTVLVVDIAGIMLLVVAGGCSKSAAATACDSFISIALVFIEDESEVKGNM